VSDSNENDNGRVLQYARVASVLVCLVVSTRFAGQASPDQEKRGVAGIQDGANSRWPPLKGSSYVILIDVGPRIGGMKGWRIEIDARASASFAMCGWVIAIKPVKVLATLMTCTERQAGFQRRVKKDQRCQYHFSEPDFFVVNLSHLGGIA